MSSEEVVSMWGYESNIDGFLLFFIPGQNNGSDRIRFKHVFNFIKPTLQACTWLKRSYKFRIRMDPAYQPGHSGKWEQSTENAAAATGWSIRRKTPLKSSLFASETCTLEPTKPEYKVSNMKLLFLSIATFSFILWILMKTKPAFIYTINTDDWKLFFLRTNPHPSAPWRPPQRHSCISWKTKDVIYFSIPGFHWRSCAKVSTRFHQYYSRTNLNAIIDWHTYI